MEILNSGSFVPLDNREKIDQLIYTAGELATEVSRAEGFQNGGQTNHQLGLEMWKGAEYVCRAHEEANIRNLFLSKFLERLREIEKERIVLNRPTQAPPMDTASVPRFAAASVSMPSTPSRPQVSEQDEYLGVVPTDEQSESNRPSYADECAPGYDANIEAIVEKLESESSDPDADGSSKLTGTESTQPTIGAAADAFVKASTPDYPVTIDQSAPSDLAAEDTAPGANESVEPESIESIVLAEKEPYNLDACTVTAVIQVLPENSGRRKCVVSLRTHDFAPTVAVSDAGAGEIIPNISASLSEALERYRIDLPGKAAEKLKKEKPAAKKQSKSGSKATKTVSVQPKAPTRSETPAAASTPNTETDQSQQGLFTS